MSREEAATAAETASDILFGFKVYPIEAGLHQILRAAKMTLELTGLDPDERERCELHRKICEYIGEDA